MEKIRWSDFLSSKLKSQIALENAEKARTWALGLLSLALLGFAIQTIGRTENHLFFQSCKLMFLILFQTFMLLGFFLPSLLQKGEKPFAKFSGIRDFTSLISIAAALTFYAVIVMMLSQQVASGAKDLSASGFFAVVAWTNFLLSMAYLASLIFFFFGLSFFPGVLAKLFNFAAKSSGVLIGIHTALFFLIGSAYFENTALGSAQFFGQFFAMALFWIFISTSIAYIGKSLRESSLPALSTLELEVTSGKLERNEDILEHYKEAYISARLSSWLSRLSHRTATRAHEIAQYAHDALDLVSREKPTELDLRQVDDRYKRAEGLYKKLEKEHQRFTACVALMELSEVEREKVGRLHDQFSRECRNAKLELASIRKRIDEKLVSLKNSFAQENRPAAIQEIPVSR